MIAERLRKLALRVPALDGAYTEAVDAFLRLEDVDIFVNAIRVPFTGRCGLRIGLSEITRRGMSESEMTDRV